MTAVARAEPASEVSTLANRDTSQVRANANHDKPFGFLDTVRIRLRIAERLPFGVFGFFDLVAGTVADEDGFAAPFY